MEGSGEGSEVPAKGSTNSKEIAWVFRWAANWGQQSLGTNRFGNEVSENFMRETLMQAQYELNLEFAEDTTGTLSLHCLRHGRASDLNLNFEEDTTGDAIATLFSAWKSGAACALQRAQGHDKEIPAD
eukprot:gene18323-93_t